MSKFKQLIESPTGSKHILQGNSAFALGVVHAGYHAADGYPGTPSTEVIDKGLAFAQDRMKVGWSVNEAVAVGVAVGHAVAGFDTVVTMKIPGVFQAGDAISTSAFFTAPSGALVLYVATDYVPSSTQHVIDVRHFFSSCRLPVLEPRSHQEMYDIAWTAADLSRSFNTPVVVLASGILAHSEGLVTTQETRTVTPRELPDNLNNWMLMPAISRKNYNTATAKRIPEVKAWAEKSGLVTVHKGSDSFGIISNSEASLIVKETLDMMGLNPSLLTLAIANPLPIETIRSFAASVEGPLLIIEDGDRFIEERLRLAGIEVTGKEDGSTITNWTPDAVHRFIAHQLKIEDFTETAPISIEAVKRPPSICPGCPYRAFGLTVAKLKKRKKIYASFGDIGCSTLLYFLNALDTVICMGASDSMRQGFVLSRPDMAHQTISVIGDSCECHSGLDATRNAVFRGTPGVKVILDNSITAMTGGQPAPSSKTNLAGVPNKFVLKDAVAAEKCRTVIANAYDLKEVEAKLTEALKLAEEGEFSTLILEGACIQEVPSSAKRPGLEIDASACITCGLCNICPGIQQEGKDIPHYTPLCTNCGGSTPVCMQRCPKGAIRRAEAKPAKPKSEVPVDQIDTEHVSSETISKDSLPDSLRVAIRGIGGQGNLFFGKVLSHAALNTPYAESHIVKGDTHGMAQLGGPVISTFACGDVHSPVLAPGTADVLVVMETGEVLRPGFLELLKPGGTILLNRFEALPITAKKDDYPEFDAIRSVLENYNVITIDTYQTAAKLGDKSGRTANVVMLGLLSTITPFDGIPQGTWIEALDDVSPTPAIKAANRKAFTGGRNYSM